MEKYSNKFKTKTKSETTNSLEKTQLQEWKPI